MVWFEIHAQDITRAQAFYEAVLALKLETLAVPEGEADDLQMVAFPMEMENGGAGGALVKAEGCVSSGVNATATAGTMVYFG